MTYKDKVEHAALCYGVTVALGPQAGITVGLTIEIVQGEAASHGLAYRARIKKIIAHFKSADTLLDLVFDTIGIFLGVWTRRLLG